MANEPTISTVGNLVSDPEIRFTPSGAAVANFTLITESRTKQDDGSYGDGQGVSVRCTAWKGLAENIAESFTKGQRVMVTGRMVGDKWQDKQTGENRHGWHLDLDDAGASSKWGVTQYRKAQRNNSGGVQNAAQNAPQVQGWGNAQNPPQRPAQGQQADPWSGGQQQAADWGNGQDDDNVPF